MAAAMGTVDALKVSALDEEASGPNTAFNAWTAPETVSVHVPLPESAKPGAASTMVKEDPEQKLTS